MPAWPRRPESVGRPCTGTGRIRRTAPRRRGREGGRVPRPPAELSSRERLAVVLERMRARLNDDDMAVQFATLIGRATWDPTLKKALLQMSGRGRAIIDGVLRDAIDRGELAPETDVEVVREGLIGTLFVRRFLSDRPLNRAYLNRIIDNALASR